MSTVDAIALSLNCVSTSSWTINGGADSSNNIPLKSTQSTSSEQVHWKTQEGGTTIINTDDAPSPTSCELMLSTGHPLQGATIVRIHLISNARFVEIYDNEMSYLTTMKGAICLTSETTHLPPETTKFTAVFDTRLVVRNASNLLRLKFVSIKSPSDRPTTLLLHEMSVFMQHVKMSSTACAPTPSLPAVAGMADMMGSPSLESMLAGLLRQQQQQQQQSHQQPPPQQHLQQPLPPSPPHAPVAAVDPSVFLLQLETMQRRFLHDMEGLLDRKLGPLTAQLNALQTTVQSMTGATSCGTKPIPQSTPDNGAQIALTAQVNAVQTAVQSMTTAQTSSQNVSDDKAQNSVLTAQLDFIEMTVQSLTRAQGLSSQEMSAGVIDVDGSTNMEQIERLVATSLLIGKTGPKAGDGASTGACSDKAVGAGTDLAAGLVADSDGAQDPVTVELKNDMRSLLMLLRRDGL